MHHLRINHPLTYSKLLSGVSGEHVKYKQMKQPVLQRNLLCMHKPIEIPLHKMEGYSNLGVQLIAQDILLAGQTEH
ncbi:hypothetical protein D3C72_2265040 [compost metagenome]